MRHEPIVPSTPGITAPHRQLLPVPDMARIDAQGQQQQHTCLRSVGVYPSR